MRFLSGFLYFFGFLLFGALSIPKFIILFYHNLCKMAIFATFRNSNLLQFFANMVFFPAILSWSSYNVVLNRFLLL